MTMAVPSKGQYGVPEGMVFGFPCVCENGVAKPVEGLELTEAAKAKILVNIAELQAEAQAVKAFVP